jgi:hypothetical protein
MDSLGNLRIKWTYAAHRVERSAATRVVPVAAEEDRGALVLARVAALGRNKEIEDTAGRRVTLFPGDVLAGVLGDRYATDQYEGEGIAAGPTGHLLSMGGVCGRMTGRNEKMPDPTIIEWVGRLADATGQPLYLRRFALRPRRVSAPRPKTLLVVGASMNSGKTTTASQAIRHLAGIGRRVAAAKITGTACHKDAGIMEDAGAAKVLDFTHCGHPSTANLAPDDLFSVAEDLRAILLETRPEFIVYEIADGILQRETRLLLEDHAFRRTIDAVIYAAPESPSCEFGVRRLREWGYNVIAVAGLVANSRLGMAEAQAATGVPCLNGALILDGAFLHALERASVA